MIAGSGDNAAAAGGRDAGSFRASRGDREQAIELLKTAFVDERLTTEELDARVGQALASKTHADLAALTADIPAGLSVSQPREPVQAHGRSAVRARGGPPERYVARHAAKASPPKSGAARVGAAVVVAAKVTLVLTLVTSIPLLFLLLVSCCVMAVIIAVAWIQISRD